MKILYVDTASDKLYIALIGEDKVISHREESRLNHSVMLLPVLDALLRENSMTLDDFDYFAANTGHAAGSGLAFARGDGTCTLTDLCRAAAWAVRWGGRFSLVFRPDRLCDLLEALRLSGFEPKRLRPVHHSVTDPVNLILLEARRGGNPGLIWEKDLYLYEPDGSPTLELQRIYRRQ